MARAFSGKTVFITGASAGIGAALAREFARQGGRLVLTARREDLLEALAAELRRNGTEVLVAPCDVTRDGDVEKAVQSAVQSFGRIDVVVANAGFGVVGKFEKLKLDDYRRQFETNVFGLMRTCYASLEELKKSKGSLVLLGSVAGYIALPNASAYAMSKFAVRALADSLWGELHPHGVAVTLVNPGFVRSEIRKVDNRGRLHNDVKEPLPEWLLAPAEKAAREIVWATARRRRERIITFHGKILVCLARRLPWAIHLISRMGARGRGEPTS